MSSPVIEIQSLCRTFDSHQVLQQVSLTIPGGCVFGLVGENGAGKTTLLKHLLGLLKPEAGRVSVFGRDPVAVPEYVLARTGFLSEDRDLPDWMTVQQLQRFQAAFYPSWDADYAAELTHTFDLQMQQKVGRLSRGQRARLGLLLAVAHRPDLLILDEPSSGLDPVVRRDILAAIIRTVADEGRTVVFSSHLLDEVQRVSDQIAMLHRGEVVLQGALDTILQNHQRLTIRLPEPRSTSPGIPGSLSCRGQGRDWEVICNGQAEEVRLWIRQHSADVMDQSTPTLSEIFVARHG